MSLSQQSVNNCSFLPRATDLPPASCFNLKELLKFIPGVNLQKSAILVTTKKKKKTSVVCQQIKLACKRVSWRASGWCIHASWSLFPSRVFFTRKTVKVLWQLLNSTTLDRHWANEDTVAQFGSTCVLFWQEEALHHFVFLSSRT